MEKFEQEFKDKSTHREVLSIRQLFMPKDLEKLKNTYFGKLVYMPEGARFYSKTEYYTQFVVNVPEGANIRTIFYTCLHYAQSLEPSGKEMDAIRKAGMYEEIFGEK